MASLQIYRDRPQASRGSSSKAPRCRHQPVSPRGDSRAQTGDGDPAVPHAGGGSAAAWGFPCAKPS